MLTHTLTEFHSFIDREPKFNRVKLWLFTGLALWSVLLILSTIGLSVQYSMTSAKAKKIQTTVTALMQSYQAQHRDVAMLLDNQDQIYREGGVSYIDYLASFPHPGVWVSDILIDLSKGNIAMSGHALSLHYLSIFLENIQKTGSPFRQWALVSTDSQKSANDTDNSFTVMMKMGGVQS